MNNKNYTVYIVLSMSGTKFSRFLKMMSGNKSEFIHVSLSFQEDLDTLYSFGRQRLNMPWIAGYVEEHPYTGVFKLYNPDCEVLSIDISEEKYQKLQCILSHVKANYKDYKYNFFGLVYLYFDKPHKLYKKFTCTEFIAWLLDNIEISPEVNKDVSLITPNDYYTIKGVKSVYKGKLHDFCLA